MSGNIKIYKDANIIGNLIVKQNANVYGNIYSYGNLILYQGLTIKDLTISNDLTVEGNIYAHSNLLIKYDSNIDGNLVVVQNANIYGNLYAYSNIITSNILLNNKSLISNPVTNLLQYNHENVLTINSANVLNVSNVIMIDTTNSMDVLFTVNGNISCTSVYLTSNVNKKKNIREITEDEINELSKIKSYNFDLKSNNNNNFGFLAHEVANVYPMLSNGETVNYIGFIPILLAKIKILENEINIIKQQLNV